jgi:hypothetical protein
MASCLTYSASSPWFWLRCWRAAWRFSSVLPLLPLLPLLAGCGSLPRPFEGYPGATALRLAQPPPVRLVVMPPANALLPDDAGRLFADDLAQALADQDVPAVSTQPKFGDWKLVLTAELEGGVVTPLFTVFDPIGNQSGIAQGDTVPAANWSAADPAMLRQAASTAAPNISALLTRIEAARRANDPNSLVNRPAKVRVPDVTGAPGDGNTQLARQMRDQLPQYGLLVQDKDPDFTVTGHVVAVPIAGNMTRIEIQWVVADAKGDERGHLVQLNEVPAGTLDRYWGDVAHVVAQEAAGGVKDVIIQQSGSRTK